MDIENTTARVVIDDTPKRRHLSTPSWFSPSFLDLNEDIKIAQQQGKIGLILYFGQDNCVYCEYLLEVNWKEHENLANYTAHYFSVVAIDIWGSLTVTDFAGKTLSEHAFSDREKTLFTPTLLFYDLTGREVFRLRGYYPPYQFRAALDYVVGAHYYRLSFRDYLEQANPPLVFDLDELNPHAIFAKPPYLLDRRNQASERFLAVFFEEGSCHACDVLHTHPLQDAAVLARLQEMEVIQLDHRADTPIITPQGEMMTAKQWAAQLHIFFAPTLLFFDKKGKEIMRIDAVIGSYRLARVLDYILTGAYQHTPQFQRWHAQHYSSD
jgi:thioredoxin-related protein